MFQFDLFHKGSKIQRHFITFVTYEENEHTPDRSFTGGVSGRMPNPLHQCGSGA
jgi:hypothetical protein